MGYLDTAGLTELWSLIKSGFQKQHKSTTVTLASGASSWTVSAEGVTADNTIVVCPTAATMDEWLLCSIRCAGQAENQLSFTSSSATESNVVCDIVVFD